MATCAGALVAVGGAPVVAMGQTPGYHLIGFPEGTNRSFATGVSADGRWVSGTAYLSVGPTAQQFTGMLWSEQAGLAGFSSEAGAPGSTICEGISGDGSVTFGQGTFTPGSTRAFRRTGQGAYENLGVLGGYQYSLATSASHDGSVVVGYNYFLNDPSGRAFRWTQASGMQSLPYPFPGEQFFSRANAVSRDGSTIVGTSRGAGDFVTVWNAAGEAHVLPHLPDQLSGEAFGVNHDGSLIVGRSGRTGVLWNNGVAQALSNPAGWRSQATDLSDDGSIILGSLMDVTTQFAYPAVWTAESGSWTLLSDYLSSQGFPLPAGWSIGGDGYSMSADGRTFVGTVAIVNGDGGAFSVTIPAVGSVATLGLGCMLLAATRRRR